MNKQLKVLVGGATGYVGGHVLCELHDKGYWVRALARDKKRLEEKKYDDVFVAEATRAETLKGVCDGIDPYPATEKSIICCLSMARSTALLNAGISLGSTR